MGSPAISFVTHVSIAIYLIEAGLVLVVAPWTDWWQRNYFADLLPGLAALMTTTSVRGLVVGAGVVTLLAGLTDLRSALAARTRGPAGGGSRHESSL